MFNWQNQKLNELHQQALRNHAEQMRLAMELQSRHNQTPTHELREQRQAERTVILAITPA